MQNILITGGAGFIGSHLVEELTNQTQNQNSKIYVIDDFSTGKMSNLPTNSSIEVIKSDISDINKMGELFSKIKFTYIYHLAAVSSVQDSIIKPVDCHKVNFDSVLNLLELSRKQEKLKKFIFASSASVFGNNPSIPCTEIDAVNPMSPYGIDKYAAERYVLNYHNLFNLPTTVFRFFNIYGPKQNPESPYSGVISIFINLVINNKEPNVTIYGDGKNTRDFVYVKDLTSILVNSLSIDKMNGHVYNIGTGVETSLLDVIEALQKITGKTIKINWCQERKGDIKRSCADNTKIMNVFNNYRFRDISVGLKNYLNI